MKDKRFLTRGQVASKSAPLLKGGPILLPPAESFRRRTGAASRIDVEQRAYPTSVINGSLLERIAVKWLDQNDYKWYFQYDIDLPQLSKARIDIAVWDTGVAQILAIEPQGGPWHNPNDESDLIRRAQLLQVGVKVVQLWEQDLIGSEERFQLAMEQAVRGIELPMPTEFGVRSAEFIWGDAMGGRS
jgi:hypothetical protein